MNKQNRVLCLCLTLLLVLSLAACDSPTDEQSSAQPTPSTQPTAAPTPTPTPPIPFTDVAQDSPYYDAVVWAYENGITSDGETFGPADACTRGQVMTFLWRAKGSPEPQTTESPFSDVSSDDWFYKPALWASENGIATGTAFNPDSPCTNAEALTFLWRAEGKPMAVAASDAYYARPLSWAETNGLFAGAEFDLAAPCSRADLMSYLYWAEGQRVSTKESRALQEEYEQIINNTWIYDVHGSGLCYADYVDVDNDGKVELLTVGISEDGFKATVTLYTSVDGHAKKSCEETFETFVGKMSSLSTGKVGSQTYLCFYGYNNYGGGYDSISHYFKIEDGVFSQADDLFEAEEYNMETDTIKHTYTASGKEITESEFNAIEQKYINRKRIFGLDFGYGYIEDRGLVPSPKSLRIAVNGSVVPRSDSSYLLKSDMSPVRDEGIMVPLGDVLEAMGVAVHINPNVILASTKSDTLVITDKDFYDWRYEGINSTDYGYGDWTGTYQYSINGGNSQELALQTDIDGIIWAPLQTIVSVFGAKAEWNGAAETIQITFDLPDSNRMSQDELNRMVNFSSEEAVKIGERNGHSFWGMMVAYIEGGYRVSHGKAIWEYAALPTGQNAVYDYDPNDGGHHEGTAPSNMYYVQVAHDGTITTSKNPTL